MGALIAERPAALGLPDHVVSSRTCDALLAIGEPAINMAIWEREPIAALASLKLAGLTDIRVTSSLRELPDVLDVELTKARYADGPERQALSSDIMALAERFAAIMNAERVEIRLEVVTTNACKKFHADSVTARLITTYIGQGTQWLSNDDAANCDCDQPHDVRQLGTGDVALFKGRIWSADAPAIHRSPAIAGTGEVRLVLVINPRASEHA